MIMILKTTFRRTEKPNGALQHYCRFLSNCLENKTWARPILTKAERWRRGPSTTLTADAGDADDDEAWTTFERDAAV